MRICVNVNDYRISDRQFVLTLLQPTYAREMGTPAHLSTDHYLET